MVCFKEINRNDDLEVGFIEALLYGILKEIKYPAKRTYLMKIIIRIRTDEYAEYKSIVVDGPIRLSDLAEQCEKELHYGALIANVNCRNRELDYIIEEDSNVTLFDMSTQLGSQTYRSSLLMIYMRAIFEIYGDINVIVENSLNQGILSSICFDREVNQEDIAAIYAKMIEIVQADLPFGCEMIDRDNAINFCKHRGLDEKVSLLEDVPKNAMIEYYNLDGYVNFFYGYMVPSTRYVQSFELRAYQDGILLRFPDSTYPDEIPTFRDDYKIYEAFLKTKMWRKSIGIEYLADLNKVISNGEVKELIEKNELFLEEQLDQSVDEIIRSGRRIILIAGPSSSGKTTFAKKLCDRISKLTAEPLYLGSDDYFLDRDETPLGADGKPDYESLPAIDLNMFNTQLNDLLEGKEVDIPSYNFLSGKKEFGERIVSIKANQLIVIEGIHGLNNVLTSGVQEKEKYRIYISVFAKLGIDRHNRVSSSDTRLLRRMIRDHRTRGASAEKTLENWYKVRSGEERNIFPYSNYADFVYNSTMVYETAIIKKYARPLLEDISPDSPQYGEALRLLYFLEPFYEIESDKDIPEESIIREFIGEKGALID